MAVCKRLQINLRNRWLKQTTDNLQAASEYLSFSDFVRLVSAEAKRQNDPIFGQDLLNTSKQSLPPNGQKKSTTSCAISAKQPAGNRNQCVVCSSGHKLFYCMKFRDMSLNEREKLVVIKKCVQIVCITTIK